MPLSAGEKLGPYEIVAPIGKGGMGEVYRAHDPRLRRDVAIKVSSQQFSERFEREAHAIAALNHPNICQIFDVGPDYLVMEFIEGEPPKGPLPLEKALEYATQIAGALDAAHSKKITHRDLKPANVLVTKQGIKLLDFGLAKIEKPVAAQPETMTMGLTMAGQILGTLLYMSPEQVNGHEADARSDIFSFGLVLYEMLTGKRAFEGATPASVIAAILERPAPSVAKVAPAALDQVLKRCLEKDPELRWQSARDLKAALALVTAPATTLSPAPSSRSVLWMAAMAAATILGAVAAWAWWRQPALETRPVLRLAVTADSDTEFTNPYFSSAISPDGRLLAFAAQKKGASTSTLWLRPLDSLTSRELPGTEDANGGFWSPDSKAIGFWANQKLKRIDLAGGSPQTLCDAPDFEGGSWSSDGVILLGATGGGLRRIPAAGGPSTSLINPDGKSANSYRYPHFLPDGRSFLYTATGLNAGGVFLASLDHPDQPVRLVDSDAKAVYAPPRNGRPGYLLWVRDQTLIAQRFDPRSKRLSGDPLPVADGIGIGTAGGGRRAAYSISSTGILVYRGGGQAGFQLAWVNRDGRLEVITSTGNDQRYGGDPSLSPDGRRIVLERVIAGNFDVWTYELSRGVMTRLTFDPGFDWYPVWSPDGRQIAFGAVRNDTPGIYRKDAGGAGPEELLLAGNRGDKLGMAPSSWSSDGRYLLFTNIDGGNIVYALPLMGKPEERKPIPYLQSPFRKKNAKFSPDGKWVAYVSNESGRDEVYIQAFPPSGGKWQVSNNEGDEPHWRGDGKELFFLGGTKMWAAGIRASAGRVEIDSPRDLFTTLQFPGPGYLYDVTRDGQRFLVVRPPGSGIQGSAPIVVLSDWQAGLKK
ncbi:MAG TPA: protein kinase [Bryobacteraceae bacterium]|nr:protein kinase [Bryobacteraceae bacterium]